MSKRDDLDVAGAIAIRAMILIIVTVFLALIIVIVLMMVTEMMWILTLMMIANGIAVKSLLKSFYTYIHLYADIFMLLVFFTVKLLK